MKKCTKCGVEKPEDLDHFYKHPEGKNGLNPCCKKCVIARSTVWHKANPEKARQAVKDWVARNPELDKARHTAWKKAHPERGKIGQRRRYWKNPELARVKNICKKHCISLVTYKQMLTQQKNCCAICAVEMKPACVDHCHKTGQIRGLLCRTCNSGVGHLQDSLDILESACEYLKRFSKSKTLRNKTTTQ